MPDMALLPNVPPKKVDQSIDPSGVSFITNPVDPKLGSAWRGLRIGKSLEDVLPAMTMLPEGSSAIAFPWSEPFPLKATVKINAPDGSSFVTKTSVVVDVIERLPVR